jgi:hypothetical protein
MHHEFMFLLCNSQDRIKKIHLSKFVKKPPQSESLDPPGKFKLSQMIHKLDEETFLSFAPHERVNIQMSKEAR